ncbi:MAG: DUF4360 domain-containing protein, partial [Pseudobdellovibrionaceae bacterium]|nr:DUF4360 domain-containing protein [Pseudobdellovibrionaceae bacterium]
MLRSKRVISSLLLSALSLATSAVASELVPDEPVSIKSINFAGGGCSWIHMPASVSEDKTALKFIYNDFKVELGPDLPLSYGRSQCAMRLKLNVPIGW